MREGNDMKIFFSWSGDESHEIALFLENWIGFVLSNVETFVSSKDIAAGEKWSQRIDENLQGSDFGIICVTRSNISSPWLLFEAGALSTAKEENRVSPFLLGIGPEDIKSTPLSQFQCTFCTEDSIRKLITTIHQKGQNANSIPGEEIKINERFNKFWPELDSKLTDYIHNKKSSMYSFSSITEGLDSIFGSIQSVNSLDIYALNTQTIVNQIESYKSLNIGSVRIINPTKSVISFLYEQRNQLLSNDPGESIKHINEGGSLSMEIWKSRIGHTIKSVDCKVIDIFPTKYLCIVDGRVGLVGYYHYNKRDRRHGLKLAETFSFDIKSANAVLKYHMNWFNNIWDVAYER